MIRSIWMDLQRVIYYSTILCNMSIKLFPQTISEGRHSVRITGLSTIDFRAGFSRKHTLDFTMTSSRPVQGTRIPSTKSDILQRIIDFIHVCYHFPHPQESLRSYC